MLRLYKLLFLIKVLLETQMNSTAFKQYFCCFSIYLILFVYNEGLNVKDEAVLYEIMLLQLRSHINPALCLHSLFMTAE